MVWQGVNGEAKVSVVKAKVWAQARWSAYSLKADHSQECNAPGSQTIATVMFRKRIFAIAGPSRVAYELC